MVRVFFIANGFAKNYLDQVKNGLCQNQRQQWVTEAHDEEDCEVIVAICTIVSRVGTDIEAALRDIPAPPKPALLVVLHHTFDPDYTVPNTQKFVDGCRMITADLLFNEEDGLIYCPKNEDSMKKATEFLRNYETPKKEIKDVPYSIDAPIWTRNILVLLLIGLFIIMLLVLMALKVSE